MTPEQAAERIVPRLWWTGYVSTADVDRGERQRARDVASCAAIIRESNAAAIDAATAERPVFIASYEYDYEGGDVISVHSSEAGARAAAEAWAVNAGYELSSYPWMAHSCRPDCWYIEIESTTIWCDKEQVKP